MRAPKGSPHDRIDASINKTAAVRCKARLDGGEIDGRRRNRDALGRGRSLRSCNFARTTTTAQPDPPSARATPASLGELRSRPQLATATTRPDAGRGCSITAAAPSPERTSSAQPDATTHPPPKLERSPSGGLSE